jgi:peptide/nickel transport system ATP-binding protein
VIDAPQHPYTRALVSVVPKPDPDDATRPEILQGETPNPADVPAGCHFHPRCPVAEDRCRSEDPALRAAGVPGQRAACLLLGDAGTAS